MFKILILVLFFSPLLVAKESEKDGTIRFSEETIEGEFNTSDLFYLLKEGSRDNQYMFKLRENFKPEIKLTGSRLEKSLEGLR